MNLVFRLDGDFNPAAKYESARIIIRTSRCCCAHKTMMTPSTLANIKPNNDFENNCNIGSGVHPACHKNICKNGTIPNCPQFEMVKYVFLVVFGFDPAQFPWLCIFVSATTADPTWSNYWKRAWVSNVGSSAGEYNSAKVWRARYANGTKLMCQKIFSEAVGPKMTSGLQGWSPNRKPNMWYNMRKRYMVHVHENFLENTYQHINWTKNLKARLHSGSNNQTWQWKIHSL